MQSECRYEYLYPDDVESILKESPICYVPLGSLGWHDLHSPLGTDSFIGHGLCVRMAEKTGGVVLPPYYWHIHGADTEGPYVWGKARGTLCTHNAEQWEAEIRTQVETIARKGWRVIVLLAGHVGQPERDILDGIASEMRKPGETQAVYVYPYLYAKGDHAGRFETNVLLGLRPDVVRDVPSMGNPFAEQPKSASTKEDGAEAVRQIVEGAVREVRDALLRTMAAEAPGCPILDERESNVSWTAKWIAPPGDKPDNYYFLARKSFEVPEPPDRAVLRITADSRYAVYLNGQFVGDGPARGTHRRYFFDRYDIAALLKQGRNWLAVEVHCPVRCTYNAAPHAPGLLAEVAGLVAADSSWNVIRDASHRADALTYTMQIGFSEWKDMRAEPEGWRTGEDTGQGWEYAEEIGTPEDFGGRVITARPISELTRDSIPPAAVSDFGTVPHAEDAAEDPDYAALMRSELHLQPDFVSFENVAALARDAGVTALTPSHAERGAYLILDFGREVLGNLIFDVEAPAGTIMDVGHDEMIEEGRLITHRLRYRFADRFVLREGRQTVEQRLHRRGFRYIQLVFRNFTKPIRIYRVRIINRIYSQETEATFSCYDPFLAKLWKACANTIRLCSSDTFMDCPWREQAFWLNDQCVENLCYLAATGDQIFPAHNLRVGADGALPNGLVPAVYPSDRKTLFPNLPSLWTFSVHDYFMYTGDYNLLRELLPTLEKGLSIYDTWRDGDGLVPDQPEMWNFIDWGYSEAGVELGGKTAPLNMLIASAYKRAAALERAVDNGARAEEYLEKSRDAVRSLNARLWDEARGFYIDCTEPVGPRTSSQIPLAVGLHFDVLEEPQRSAAAANLLHPDLVRAELYFQHYVIQALAMHGRVTDAMGVMRARWREMIEAGSDTIWETSRGRKSFTGCGSLCHGFACAPLYFMQSVLLGVQPLKPGFEDFALAPQSADLNSAWGSVPTPHGPIRAKWERKPAENMILNVEVPEGTRAVLGDGRSLPPGRHELVLP